MSALFSNSSSLVPSFVCSSLSISTIYPLRQGITITITIHDSGSGLRLPFSLHTDHPERKKNFGHVESSLDLESRSESTRKKSIIAQIKSIKDPHSLSHFILPSLFMTHQTQVESHPLPPKNNNRLKNIINLCLGSITVRCRRNRNCSV